MSELKMPPPRRPMLATNAAVYRRKASAVQSSRSLRSLRVGGVMYPWNREPRRHRRPDQPDLSWKVLTIVAVCLIVAGLIVFVATMAVSGPVADAAVQR